MTEKEDIKMKLNNYTDKEIHVSFSIETDLAPIRTATIMPNETIEIPECDYIRILGVNLNEEEIKKLKDKDTEIIKLSEDIKKLKGPEIFDD